MPFATCTETRDFGARFCTVATVLEVEPPVCFVPCVGWFVVGVADGVVGECVARSTTKAATTKTSSKTIITGVDGW